MLLNIAKSNNDAFDDESNAHHLDPLESVDQFKMDTYDAQAKSHVAKPIAIREFILRSSHKDKREEIPAESMLPLHALGVMLE